MALVDTGFVMSLTVQDKQGDQSTLVYGLQGADATAAAADAAAVLAAFPNVSDAQILSYSINNVFRENLPAYPAQGDVSVKARISARKTDSSPASLDIPAPKEALFVDTSGPNNNIVDMSNAALLAYLALFYGGGATTISDGELLVAGGGISGERVTVARRRKRR